MNRAMRVHDVVVVGAGPTGLMLAGELALAGIDVALVERRRDQTVEGARAGGLQARTIDELDQRGIADRFLSEGQVAQVAGFAMTRLDIGDFPTRHNYGLALRQRHVERILAAWLDELPVVVYRGSTVTGFSEDATGIEVHVADGSPLRTRYLVGSDGGRSIVRKTAGIEFPGWDATGSNLLAEVEMTDIPDLGVHHGRHGIYAFGREEYEIIKGKIVYADHGPITVMVPDQHPGAADEPTLDNLREALLAVCGRDFGVHSPLWISRFGDTTRQAATYRKGRVILAGDAAHIHSPVGGQGLNIGLQDAVNLGWKLAQVILGVSPDELLDSYHAERHPVATRTLRMTMAQVALLRPDDRTVALRDAVSDLLSMEEPRKRVAAMQAGLDIRYDLQGDHPMIGRRMPDLDLHLSAGPLRTFSLLHEARPLLLNLAENGRFDELPLPGRVRLVEATTSAVWELPLIGEISAPSAVLIRPDGYVAWAGNGSDAGLVDALGKWFGAPREAGRHRIWQKIP